MVAQHHEYLEHCRLQAQRTAHHPPNHKCASSQSPQLQGFVRMAGMYTVVCRVCDASVGKRTNAVNNQVIDLSLISDWKLATAFYHS